MPNRISQDQQIIARGFARKAVLLCDYAQIEPRVVRRQAIRSGVTAFAAFVGLIATFLFVLFGPELSRHDSVFAVFVLFVCFALFLFGVLTAILPLMTAVVCGKLQTVRAENRLAEAAKQENARQLELKNMKKKERHRQKLLDEAKKKARLRKQDLSKAIEIIDEVRENRADASKILDMRAGEIAELKSHLVGSGC